MKKNLLYILVATLISTSCVEKDIDNVSPSNGQEVKFTACMDANNGSRTIYGAEESDGTSTSIKVNWVDGDNITVYGAKCSVNQANYSVNTGGKEQNFANSLDKIGASGVQWGNENSDFYAVYPAIEKTFSPDEFYMEIRDVQNNYFFKREKSTVWESVPYMDDLGNPTMCDALMYAYSSNVSPVDKNGNPNVVNFRFKPFSTVLKFTLSGASFFQEVYNNNGELLSVDEVTPNEPAIIKRIIIQSPDVENYQIAGNCKFQFVDGKPKYIEGGSSNMITIQPNYLTLTKNESVEFSVFVIPRESYIMSENYPWSITLDTDHGEFSFDMKPTPVYNDEGEEVGPAIKSGMVHKMSLPKFNIITNSRFDLTKHLNNWVRYIPRNVYLSELSVPGAWYATNGDYQSTTDLSEQYKAGVRAFNIDCRMTATADSWDKKWAIVTYYTLKDNPTYTLQCAGSETLTGQKVGSIERVESVGDGLTVESQLETLSKLVQPDEFIYVVLTIAEKPKDLSGMISDASETFGNNVDPNNVLSAIKDILTRKGSALKVFGYREQDSGKTLNANTTINDVLGSMIIKINVNVNQEETDLTNYGLSNVLLSEGSMASESKYIAPPIVAGSFKVMNEANMYWGNVDSGLMYYYHHAQMTKNSTEESTDATPSFKDRKDAIDEIIAKSAEIYKTNQHNALFQISVGGRLENDNRTTVASELNPYMLDKINDKLDAIPSPVGIVLMNYCTNNDYRSLDLINSIVTMNTKFFLNRDVDAESGEWPDGNPFSNEEDNGEY